MAGYGHRPARGLFSPPVCAAKTRFSRITPGTGGGWNGGAIPRGSTYALGSRPFRLGRRESACRFPELDVVAVAGPRCTSASVRSACSWGSCRGVIGARAAFACADGPVPPGVRVGEWSGAPPLSGLISLCRGEYFPVQPRGSGGVRRHARGEATAAGSAAGVCRRRLLLPVP